MNVKPHPQYKVFLSELKETKHPFGSWRGIAFRAAPLPYARVAKLLDGKGSLRFGGRWSAPGTFPAVNLSLTPVTALQESTANFTYYNFAATDVKPKVVVGIRFNLTKVVDLTNPHGITHEAWLRLDELLSEDWRKLNDAGHESQTQAFGRATHDLAAEAMLAPSARIPGGVNLVFFPGPLARASEVEVLGHRELEEWLGK